MAGVAAADGSHGDGTTSAESQARFETELAAHRCVAGTSAALNPAQRDPPEGG